ncbi:hypothetical protein [Streptomyces sp. NPDC008092]|uniref:hypothetical protein n=1 Tax=Streptomyces sp. NPDC008092 TaxID=3364808 RepID=UPI0036E802B1
MTHARARTNADYTALTPAQQDRFDDLMEQADHARTGDAYHDAMTEAALTATLPVPASRDIARCSCYTDAGGCGCATIFDSHAPGAVVTAVSDPGYNLSGLQCPTCGHDHPRPIAD